MVEFRHSTRAEDPGGKVFLGDLGIFRRNALRSLGASLLLSAVLLGNAGFAILSSTSANAQPKPGLALCRTKADDAEIKRLTSEIDQLQKESKLTADTAVLDRTNYEAAKDALGERDENTIRLGVRLANDRRKLDQTLIAIRDRNTRLAELKARKPCTPQSTQASAPGTPSPKTPGSGNGGASQAALPPCHTPAVDREISKLLDDQDELKLTLPKLRDADIQTRRNYTDLVQAKADSKTVAEAGQAADAAEKKYKSEFSRLEIVDKRLAALKALKPCPEGYEESAAVPAPADPSPPSPNDPNPAPASPGGDSSSWRATRTAIGQASCQDCDNATAQAHAAHEASASA